MVSPDSKHVYTTAKVENALAVWERDASTGALSLLSVVRNGAAVEGSLAKAQSLVISPDGMSIYVGASGPTNAVSVFGRNPTTGSVTFLQKVTEADGPGWTPPPTGPPIDPPVGPPVGPGNGAGDGANQGMTINGGALYTNDPDVTLSVIAPNWAKTLRVANDGGFLAAKTFPVRSMIRWRLAESGPERLPKTVYLRFGNDAQNFTDDIILDQTEPTVSSATLAPASSRASAAVASATASRARTYLVRLRAKDQTSGVAKLQFANNRRRPSALRKFERNSRYKGVSAPKYVRVRDRAGNFSRWRSIR